MCKSGAPDLHLLLVCRYNKNVDILDIVLRLFVALVLGGLLGAERVFAHKTAGLRTYALVSMGAALFIVISETVGREYLSLGLTNFDLMRVAAQIVVGIGFLGAGLIIFREKKSELVGITTAAGIWVSAGIGMAAGFGLYALAIVATLFALFVFVVLWYLEEKLRKKEPYDSKECPECGRQKDNEE